MILSGVQDLSWIEEVDMKTLQTVVPTRYWHPLEDGRIHFMFEDFVLAGY